MATDKPKPFLTAIKEQVDGIFADAYDHLTDGQDSAEVLKTARKQVWDLMETKLKESYRNGQAARTNGRARADVAEDPAAPTNPFRRSG